jgi:hypothetical protein
MFDIESNGFIGDGHTMYEWCHNYDIVNCVDHLGLDLVGPLIMTVHGNILGISIVLQVSWDSVNPTKKRLRVWIDHMKDSYDG